MKDRLHSSQCLHTRHIRSILILYLVTCLSILIIKSSRLRGGKSLLIFVSRICTRAANRPKLALPQPIHRPVVQLETRVSFTGRASNNATFPTRSACISAAHRSSASARCSSHLHCLHRFHDSSFAAVTLATSRHLQTHTPLDPLRRR